MVNNSNFQPSNGTVCQQMTWPFTYTDGINLRPKQCEDETSYFLCSLKCNLSRDIMMKVIKFCTAMKY